MAIVCTLTFLIATPVPIADFAVRRYRDHTSTQSATSAATVSYQSLGEVRYTTPEVAWWSDHLGTATRWSCRVVAVVVFCLIVAVARSRPDPVDGPGGRPML